ncbi:1-phosphofructokinase family hexose kinase [Mycolicibacterium flavescens]|uniref:Phosphofructokinase n=1 Tax=Mycolicibacterium flavescens TaxID=1776 RepID=A0A1E3R830_MYCFV|nr:1-phosphofructokinase family hexose kinase [Mycolicibacterium flavescens]MCV7282614.1 1-phosphofructokinase family hexose kinase [Mycolicibacterium flavescens]ODQ86098.1 phosphofructokinase [Mycolicibacterium flavescens]
MRQRSAGAGRSRIVTLTMNPALDITTTVEAIHPTSKVRCSAARYDAGGGGINVARIASVLGIPTSVVFPSGGSTGAHVESLLSRTEVPARVVPLIDSTRESFTVHERATGEQYRFVLPGPHLTIAERNRCLEELRLAAQSVEFVVASGSLPPSVPADWYQLVADICRDVGARLVLDTSGNGLMNVRSGVFLLKPSLRELRECVGRDLVSHSEQVDAARELIDRGITESVVVSLGADGALLVTAREAHHFAAVAVNVVSGVGAGDAMVAGIVVGLVQGQPLVEAVRLGVAAGTAMLLTPGTAAPSRSSVERFVDLVSAPTSVAPLTA